MSEPTPQPIRLNRRIFVGALAGAAGLSTSTKSIAQDPAPPAQPDPLDAEVDARMALVVARYGARLDEDARKAIRDDIRQHIRRARRLKEFTLENGDGPHTVMTAYRSSPR